MKKLRCPECGSNQFTCSAVITAVLQPEYDSDDELNYKLQYWDDIRSIQEFNCQNCGYGFEGDEDEFMEEVEVTPNDSRCVEHIDMFADEFEKRL